MSVRVVVEGANEAALELEAYGEHLDDWAEFWPDVIDTFTRREKQWFVGQGRGSWPPLSSKYARWKAVHWPGRPTMVRTGDLMRTLTTDEAVLRATEDDLYLGTTVPYAFFHHEGRGYNPLRRLLPPAEVVAAGISRILEEWVRWRGVYWPGRGR